MNPIQHAYNTWAASYDSDENRTRDLDQLATQQALKGLHCHSIVELGCGTGKNTAFLAELGTQVHAFDFSESMLAYARARITQPHVHFSQTDILNPWPCASQSVDLVVANLVLEHLEELEPVFAEAQRVLVAGGQFFICELHPFQQYNGKQARFEHEQQSTFIPAFVHHISDFFQAGQSQGFTLEQCQEWWHASDHGLPPRLLSCLFRKAAV